jgi:ubiquinone/menaquinone biosynthesis C-methylase UbiE
LSLPGGTERVLDAGCGGGRYSVAWKALGAASVLGVDLSEKGIDDARRRVADYSIDDVEFRIASVHDLPIDDSSVDIVFSNGVLHHSTDWEKGVDELVRVMKPGGMGWLYLIEQPGGLFWDVIEILRALLKDEEKETARVHLSLQGLPANRVFYMLDHVMAPINLRLTSEQIESALEKAGGESIRRLNRGCDFDRVEQIFNQQPFATTKYGAGEHRFVFSKA